MTKNMHQLIFIWIISAGLYSVLTLSGALESGGILLLIPIFMLTFVFLAIKESGTTVRLILSGILLSLFLIFFILFRQGILELNDKILTVTALITGASAAALIVGELSLRIRAVRISIACGSAVYQVLLFFVNVPITKLFVLSSLFFILVTVIEEVQLGWHRKGSGSTDHLVFIFPFLLATMIFVAVSPVSDDPYDWHFVRKIYSDVSNAIDNIRRELSEKYIFDPSVTLIGFSESGDIRGNLSSYDTEVMELENISFGTRQLRLRGKSFDTFTGRNWENTFTVPDNESVADTYSLISSVGSYTGKPYDLIKRSHFTIKTIYADKSIVFSPLKTDIINSSSSGAPEIYFYSLNSDNIAFKEYLASAPFPEESSFSGDDSDISYKAYVEYSGKIHGLYAKEPVLSPGTRAILDSIFDGCSNDVEKLDALSAFLNSFPYTETPGDLPDHVTDQTSFLDYFLLESKCGYCSHFATAFVLLARSEGIPARYVQGYLVPVKEGGCVTVTSSMAHAWAEVYFDGAGWITYDPTPGFNVRSYWRTSSDESATDSYSHYENIASEEAAESTGSEDPDDEKEHIQFDPGLLIIPCAVILSITVLMFVIYRLVQAVSFSKKSLREKYILHCRQILLILKLSGHPIASCETVSEYKKRLPDGILSDDFIDSLNLFLYNDSEPDENERQAVLDTGKHLLYLLKKEKPMRFILFKIGIYGTGNYLAD